MSKSIEVECQECGSDEIQVIMEEINRYSILSIKECGRGVGPCYEAEIEVVAEDNVDTAPTFKCFACGTGEPFPEEVADDITEFWKV
jgi:uncharacterized Zn finger protein